MYVNDFKYPQLLKILYIIKMSIYETSEVRTKQKPKEERETM